MVNYSKIIRESINKVLNEETLKPGQTFRLPFTGLKALKLLSQKYGCPPTDFYYDQNNNYFVYKPHKKPKKKKPSDPSKPKGRPEGMSDQEYLELVRRENQAFADAEREYDNEEWRPVRNNGRYCGGETDYARTHEVSNMGRLRTIDFNDPMNSRISIGHDNPARKSRQYHLDIIDKDGKPRKTTPHVHTIVAGAWLDDPEDGLAGYDVEHIDGNYHNNRADNLRYVKRKGKKNKKKESNENMRRTLKLTESGLRKVIIESVKRCLNEWQFDNDLEYQRIADEAYDWMEQNEPNGYDWRDVAEGMGYRLESLGPNDMETMQEAIEAAMHDYYVMQDEMETRQWTD